MLLKFSEFFKNIPAKKCNTCGKEMDEQHECYGNKCNDCLLPKN